MKCPPPVQKFYNNLIFAFRNEDTCKGNSSIFSTNLSKEANSEETYPFILKMLRELQQDALNTNNIYELIYACSALATLDTDSIALELLIDSLLNDNTLEIQELHFIYAQIIGLLFRENSLETRAIHIKMQLLLRFIVGKLSDSLPEKYQQKITKVNRNSDLVFVLTEQFLDVQHGPTKSALDRAYVLKRVYGKNVLLINTSEHLQTYGKLPFYNYAFGEYNSELIHREYVSWKDESIPYFQFPNQMPRVDLVSEMLEIVYKQRPAYVIQIGASGLVAPLIAKMVPVLTVGMCPSTIAYIQTTAQTYSLPLYEEDFCRLAESRIDAQTIIPGIFTMDILPVKQEHTLEEIGLSRDDFCIALVGGRLTTELTEEFLDVLEKLISEVKQYSQVKVLLFGKCDLFNKILDWHPGLKDVSQLVGFVEDTQSWLKLCKLYINPPRRGGGTSSVEAMAQGVPVITLPYGDVAVAVGEEFWISDWDELSGLVRRYVLDKLYYEEQSTKAIARSELLRNTEKCFIEIINEFEKRCEFLFEPEYTGKIDKKSDGIPQDKKISIIIPCYNVEKYVSECLESVITQSMPDDEYEIIVIDDCSDDGTLQIIKSYEQKYPEQIILIQQNENAGVGIARNIGISYASGEYLIFVDADDRLCENALLLLYEAATSVGADIAESGFYQFDAYGHRREFTRQTQIYDFLMKGVLEDYLVRFGSLNAPWAKLFRKDLIVQNNIWFAEGFTREDIVFYQLALAHTRTIVSIQKSLYEYRQNPQGASFGNTVIDKCIDAYYVQENSYQRIRTTDAFEWAYHGWEFLYFRKAFQLVYATYEEYGKLEEKRFVIEEIVQTILQNFPGVLENPYFEMTGMSDYVLKFRLIAKR